MTIWRNKNLCNKRRWRLPETVILEDILDNNVNTIIGKRIDNIMNPVLEGFENVGLEILKKI